MLNIRQIYRTFGKILILGYPPNSANLQVFCFGRIFCSNILQNIMPKQGFGRTLGGTFTKESRKQARWPNLLFIAMVFTDHEPRSTHLVFLDLGYRVRISSFLSSLFTSMRFRSSSRTSRIASSSTPPTGQQRIYYSTASRDLGGTVTRPIISYFQPISFFKCCECGETSP